MNQNADYPIYPLKTDKNNSRAYKDMANHSRFLGSRALKYKRNLSNEEVLEEF